MYKCEKSMMRHRLNGMRRIGCIWGVAVVRKELDWNEHALSLIHPSM
jgi:hypothetical protein